MLHLYIDTSRCCHRRTGNALLHAARHTLAASLVFALAACGAGGSGDETESDSPTAPATVGPVAFSQTPPNSSSDVYAIFQFSAAGASTYECALDSASYASCSSPHVVLPVAEGSHRLRVRAVDSGGAPGPASETEWNVVSVLTADHPVLAPTNVIPAASADQSWRGIFRINCDFSHASYNDPIVYPNQSGAAHLHMFYGNLLTDHTTTMNSLYSSGDASCQGNTLNRSAYWVPALLAPLYDESGERELDDNGEPAWQVVQAVVGNDDEAHEVFYYSAGIDDLASIQPVPAGLRMIAGTASSQPGQEQSTSIVRWHCQTWESNDGNNPHFSASIPVCVAPDRLRFDIFFPSCWDGVNLDSADHKSHMAYPINNGGPNGTVCPSSHPVPVARVSYHYAFGVRPENYDPISRSSRGWRLASDMYTINASQAGGVSLHGDWFNGWHPEVMEMLVENCIHAGLDCHDGNLANGKRLSGTQPGSQLIPEIVNEGMGEGHKH